MKILPIADAFRAIIRATNPEREDLQQIDSYRWFHDRQKVMSDGHLIHDQADAPAYAALDLLKANVKGQKIRLRGVLENAQPDDIDPIDAREGELDVFAGTLKIYESKATFRISRIYTGVHCCADDLPLSKGKGGRPPVVDWTVVSRELKRLMDYHDEFGADVPEWNAQARLVECLQRFCLEKFGIEPANSTIEGHIKEPLAIWREKKASRPET
jgi:hypothetical protein